MDCNNDLVSDDNPYTDPYTNPYINPYTDSDIGPQENSESSNSAVMRKTTKEPEKQS
ncbi:11771_t:CDS:1, partial [Cetraspora pellucida]